MHRVNFKYTYFILTFYKQAWWWSRSPQTYICSQYTNT